MESRHWCHFIAVAEAGTVARAAEHVFLTQSRLHVAEPDRERRRDGRASARRRAGPRSAFDAPAGRTKTRQVRQVGRHAAGNRRAGSDTGPDKARSERILLAGGRSILNLPRIKEAAGELLKVGHRPLWTDDYTNSVPQHCSAGEFAAIVRRKGSCMMKQQPVAVVSDEIVGHPAPSKKRPCIKLSRNGPYLATVDDLTNSKGERLNGSHGVALCRCGASNRKPFCDSSHIRIGFSDERHPDHTPDGVVDYRGAAIVVHFNRLQCSASERCAKALPLVFREGQKPWIQADQADADTIIDGRSTLPIRRASIHTAWPARTK